MKCWFPKMTVIVSMCVLIFLMGEATGVEYYCSRNSEVTISGETEGSIRTLYPGDTAYQNNQNCAWVIDAGANHRVEITVVSSNLQWAPESAICTGYDHVAIKDGKEPGQNIVLQWCGPSRPLGAVSPGRYLRVEFMSDENNPYSYTGVHLTFKTFSTQECAPSWKNGPTNFCYKLLDKTTDWRTAQQECNAERANLVSVTEDSELDFLAQTYKKSLYRTAWIGLSDISKLGSYSWIDETNYKTSAFPVGQQPDQFKRCVAFHFENKAWYLHNCDSFLTHPLCKASTGNTKLYPIPKDEGKKVYKVPIGMIAGIVVGFVVLVVLIIGLCYFYKKRQTTRYQAPRTTEPEDRLQTAVTYQQSQSPAQSNRVPDSLPPSYDDVMSERHKNV